MKNHFLKLVVLSVLAGTGFAGQPDYKTPMEIPSTCFADQEFSLDAFGSYNDGIRHRPRMYRDGFGGGLAANYFFARYFGLSAEANWWEGGSNDRVIHAVSGSVVLRYPLDSFCVAPYILGGGGGNFDGTSIGFGHVGGGAEYRVNPRVGIFADGRYVFTATVNDVATYRFGIRYVF